MEDVSRQTLRGFRDTFVRFPLPLTCALMLAIVLMIQVHSGLRIFTPRISLPAWREWFPLIIASLCAAKLALISHALYFERRPAPFLLTGTSALLVLIAIPLLYSMADSPWLHGLFLMPALLLLLMSAPYLGTRVDDATYCNFNCGLFHTVIYGIIGGTILSAGLSGAMAGIEYLFEIRMRRFYADIWIIGMLLANYWILARMPRLSEVGNDTAFIPKGTLFLTTYILVPLIVVYFIILYAYIGKIIITAALPRGGVAYMVLACGGLGVLAYFLTYPMRDTATRWVVRFRRYFFPALIAPLLLLWVGIVQRISDYGVTEDRYLVLCLAMWLSIICIHAIGRRHRNQFLFISLTASLLLLLASFGPWGAVSISKRSQKAQLEEMLQQGGMQKDGKIVTPTRKRELDEKQYRRIESILSYLYRTGKTDVMADWFPEGAQIRNQILHGKQRVSSYTLMNEMGLIRKGWSTEGPQDTQFSFNLESDYRTIGSNALTKVTGFDYLIQINGGKNQDKAFEIDGKQIRIELQADDRLRIFDDAGQMVMFNLADTAEALIRRYPKNGNARQQQIRKDDSTVALLGSSGKLTAYLLLTHLRGNSTWKEGKITQYSGKLMLRYGEPLTDEQVQILNVRKVIPQTTPPFMPVPPPLPDAQRPVPHTGQMGNMAPNSAMDKPKSEPFDISVAGHRAYAKKFEGRTNRKAGEFAVFGSWDNGDCYNNDQYTCGGITSRGTGCVMDFPACASGKAVATESYEGDRQCVIRWWKWGCR